MAGSHHRGGGSDEGHGKGIGEFKCPFSLKEGGDVTPSSLP
jgi:hypothetical protein